MITKLWLTTIIFSIIHGFIALPEESLSNQGHNPAHRIPRGSVTTGIGAIGRLLRTARHYYTDGLNHVFIKNGRLKDAMDDFLTLNPSDVNGLNRKEKVYFTGKVNTKQVTLETRGDLTTIDITNTLHSGERTSVPVVHRIILYTNEI